MMRNLEDQPKFREFLLRNHSPHWIPNASDSSITDPMALKYFQLQLGSSLAVHCLTKASQGYRKHCWLQKKSAKKGLYSYVRFSRIVVDMAFEGNGNWNVHRKCLSDILPVSCRWLSDKNNEAIKICVTAIVSIEKATISSSPRGRINRLIDNIILQEECTPPDRQLFWICWSVV